MKNQLLPSPGSQRVDAAVKTQLKMTAFLYVQNLVTVCCLRWPRVFKGPRKL